MNSLRSHAGFTPSSKVPFRRSAQVTSSTMELLPLASVVCVCALSWCHGAAGAGVPVSVLEGSDVVLPCWLDGADVERLLFDWKKDGQQEVFLYDGGPQYARGRSGQDQQFRGRVAHFPAQLKHGNASVLLSAARVADSGNYSCHFPRLQPHARVFYVQLLVGASPEPSLVILEETRDWAVLQCSVRGASPEPVVHWEDAAGHPVPSAEPEVTQRDGRFHVVLQTTVTRTGRYRCVSTQDAIHHRTSMETFVGLDGAASKPWVTILDQTSHWAVLRCEVFGSSPKAALVWTDGAGKRLPAEDGEVTQTGGGYDVALRTTVTRSDRYRCQASQDQLQHRTHADIYVHISDSTGWIVAAVLAAVLVVVVIVFLVFLVHTGHISCNKGSCAARSRSLSSQQLPDQPTKERQDE